MRLPLHRIPTVIVLFAVAVACSRKNNPSVVGATPAIADSVAVEVVNDNYYDARVYVVYAGGGKYPLGTVRSHTIESDLRFAWQPRHLAFEVHLVTGFQTYLSHEVDVAPGDYLQLRLPPNFEVSDSFTRISR